MTMAPPDGAVDLWAMAAELERQFAGYKQRFPERKDSSYDIAADDDAPDDAHDDTGALHGVVDNGGVRSGEEDDAGGVDGAAGGVRGRMYEAYTRRRDERLRTVWRARMERKEAEVMALWARLDAVRAGRNAGGGGNGGPAAAEEDEDDDCAAGEEIDDDGEKRRSSDVAAPGRVSGKKHSLTTRSFSAANLSKSSRPDAGPRRAVSQEPPPPSDPAPAGADGGSMKHGHRSRAATGGAAPKRKALSGSKGLAKEHGSLRQTGTKPPRGGLPRPCASGGPEAALLSNTCVATPARLSISSEQAAASDRDDEARETTPPPGPFVGSGNGTGAENALAASPKSEGGEAAEAENAVVSAERRDGEEIAVQAPDTEAKLGNGEITSDSETEPSYVFIKKVVEGEAVRLSDAMGAGSDAEPRLDGKNDTGDAYQATTAADADTTAEIATTGNAEESSDELSSFSGTGMSCRDSAPNSALSCSSRSQSIERLLEEDVALLQKKRQSACGRRSAQEASTPPSARSRGAASAAQTTSPRGTAVGFKKRFLSFGKKTRDRDGATVIDCTSPASVPASPADSGSGSARWRCRTADPIRRRVVGSSSDAAASSDDTEHGYAASPQACSLQSLVAASPAKSELSEMVPQEKSPKSHRSFFSFRSFNCGRG